jgi:hypothetical protein
MMNVARSILIFLGVVGSIAFTWVVGRILLIWLVMRAMGR